MKTFRFLNPFPVLVAASLIAAPLAQAANYGTNFSNYSTGWLGNNSNWILNTPEDDGSKTNKNSPFYIVQGETTTGSVTHPSALSGSNLLWVNPKTLGTTGMSSNSRRATLTFSETLIHESFTFSTDVYVGQPGGLGSSMTFYLGKTGAETSSAAARFSFASLTADTFALRISNLGAGTDLVTLNKGEWLRFEIALSVLSDSTTYNLKVYSLNDTGGIVKTLFTSATYNSTLAGGYNTFQVMTDSTRLDCWVDNITINTIPEPQTLALLGGGFVLMLAFVFRRR